MTVRHAERVVRAVMENLGNWQERLAEIEQIAPSDNGNKARALSLLRDMEQARVSLERLLKDFARD